VTGTSLSPNSRRQFIQIVGAAAMAAWRADAAPRAASLSFSTMGCPEWSLETVFKKGREYGFSGVELRGVRGEMDLTRLPEFTPGRRKATLREASDSNLRIINLCASTLLHESDSSKLQVHMDEAHRFIDLGHELGVPYIRVFPGSAAEGKQRTSILKQIEENLRRLGEYAKGTGVTVLIESHPGVSDSQTLSEILARVGMPDVGLLWDTGHTFGEAHEQPAETYGRLKQYVRLAQFMDFVLDGDKIHYVLLGEGQMPVRDAVRILKQANYGGYYSFDWPKLWHREIAEPETAFPQFVKKMREYFASV
jgi:sugar phosphate isomerase/epimerase